MTNRNRKTPRLQRLISPVFRIETRDCSKRLATSTRRILNSSKILLTGRRLPIRYRNSTRLPLCKTETCTALRRCWSYCPNIVGLRERTTRLEGQIGLDKDELAKAGEAELVDLDRARLEHLAEDLSSVADRADDLRREIADINAQVSEAKRATSLQDLIARRENARAELKNRRDEVMFAETESS